MTRCQSDVIVIGAGIAGTSAALELLDRGRRVLILDRDVEANLGGLARESFGGFWFADTPIQRRHRIRDSKSLGLRDWRSYAEFGPEDHWPQAWAEAYVYRANDEVYGWLRGLGVDFMPLPLWVERGLNVPGNSVPRWHIVWGTGSELSAVLNRRLMSHPRRDLLTIRFEHRVEALDTTDGRVSGCRGTVEGLVREFEARAESVIVAAGGISGDLERVRRHWPADLGRPPETLLNGAHRFADGRLHDAVEQIGGRVTHLDWQWNYAAGVHHWAPRIPAHGLSLVPPKSALWLNWRGERIGPTPLVSGYDTHEIVSRICAEERSYSWQLLNRKIALRELAISGSEFNPAFRDKSRAQLVQGILFGNRRLYEEVVANCEDFIVADTLPELVERMNALVGDDSVDLETVSEAARSYDARIDLGPRFHDDDQLRRIAFARRWLGDRIRTCNAQKILDPRAGPLVAIREFILSRKSMGGVQTDLSSRVLGDDGEPVGGLFAAGETAGFGGGGMNGKRGLEGTFLGGCVFGGRIAGREA
ncbi:MAG: FAD-binding dehydrogenase [marine benthic group bacterium]|nr:FAD-binding dehydrogenase [Gemmatimonadota bacterium]MCL7968283.1 FAD-binding dehydrogenase [Gemmatimonadota bacterium]